MATAMGRCVSDLIIDGVKGSNIDVLVVPDDEQVVELIVRITFSELPHLAYARVDGGLIFAYRHKEPFRDLRLETTEGRLQLRMKEAVLVSREVSPENEVNFVSATLWHSLFLLL